MNTTLNQEKIIEGLEYIAQIAKHRASLIKATTSYDTISSAWWKLLENDARAVAKVVTGGLADLEDGIADLRALSEDLKKGLLYENAFETINKDLIESYIKSSPVACPSNNSQPDNCACSARDLWTAGHKCGRKAPVDR